MPIIYKPVSNVCVDMDITIATTDWSSSAPYTYDWMNQVISGDCSVEVNYLAGALNYKDVYISYEKITGGIEFTAPVKPTVDIPVRIHIVNTLASDVLDLSGDMVSTSAVSGAVNVDEALSSLKNSISTINTNLSTYKISSGTTGTSTWTFTMPATSTCYELTVYYQSSVQKYLISQRGSSAVPDVAKILETGSLLSSTVHIAATEVMKFTLQTDASYYFYIQRMK